MDKKVAHQVLNMLKDGARVPAQLIDEALRATGDLPHRTWAIPQDFTERQKKDEIN